VILFGPAALLAQEIAKNVCLAGVKAVTIHDTKAASNVDLGGQFYLSEAHVGQNRAEATLPLLQALNPTVTVKASSQVLLDQPELLEGFNVVILCDTLLEDSININEICRAKGIKLLVADVSMRSPHP